MCTIILCSRTLQSVVNYMKLFLVIPPDCSPKYCFQFQLGVVWDFGVCRQYRLGTEAPEGYPCLRSICQKQTLNLGGISFIKGKLMGGTSPVLYIQSVPPQHSLFSCSGINMLMLTVISSNVYRLI